MTSPIKGTQLSPDAITGAVQLPGGPYYQFPICIQGIQPVFTLEEERKGEVYIVDQNPDGTVYGDPNIPTNVFAGHFGEVATNIGLPNGVTPLTATQDDWNAAWSFTTPVSGMVLSAPNYIAQYFDGSWKYIAPGNTSTYWAHLTTTFNDLLLQADGTIAELSDSNIVQQKQDAFISGSYGLFTLTNPGLVVLKDTSTLKLGCYPEINPLAAVVPDINHTHSDAVSGGASGFMSGTDKTTLDYQPTTYLDTIQTTNATVTTVRTIALTGSTGTVRFLNCYVKMVKSDGSGGGAWQVCMGYERKSTGWQLINTGGLSAGIYTGSGAYDFAPGTTIVPGLSGSNALVRVTGVAATTLNWTIRTTIE